MELFKPLIEEGIVERRISKNSLQVLLICAMSLPKSLLFILMTEHWGFTL